MIAPTLVEVLEEFLRDFEQDLHTAFPARVELYDAGTQTVDVKPCIGILRRGEDNAREFDELPIIPTVPVAFPRGGGYGLTVPIQKGDFVLVVCSEASIARWRSDGTMGDQGDFSRHVLNGCVAIPGVHTSKGKWSTLASTSALVAGKDGGPTLTIGESQAVLGDGGISKVSVSAGQVSLGAGTESVILGDTFMAELQLVLADLTVFLGTLNPVTGVTDAAAASIKLAATITAFNVKAALMKSMHTKTE